MGKVHHKLIILFIFLVISCSPQSMGAQEKQTTPLEVDEETTNIAPISSDENIETINNKTPVPDHANDINAVLQLPISIPAECPTPEDYIWSKFLNADTSFITKILPAEDGNYYLSGVVDHEDALWVAKMNPEGELLWQNLYGKKFGDLQLALNGNLIIEFGLTSLEIDPDGKIVRGVDVPKYQPNSDGSITAVCRGQTMRYTDYKTPLWQIITQNPNVLSVPTTDGGALYAYAGTYVDDSVYYKPVYTDLKVIKIDSLGNVRQHVYGKLLGDETVDQLLNTPDGGALLVGTNSYEIYGLDYDIWLMKLNGGGIPSWQATLKLPPDIETLQNIQVFSTGFVATILTRSSNDPILVRFTKKGELIWQKQISSIRGEVSVIALADTPDGGLIVSGETNEENNVSFLARLSPKGDLLWEKTLGFADIAKAPNTFIEAIHLNQNGEILLGGGSNLVGQSVSDTSSAWVAKILDDGEVFNFLMLTPGKFSVSDTLASRPNTLQDDVFEIVDPDLQEIDFPVQETHFQVLPACLADGVQFPTPEALPTLTPPSMASPLFKRDLLLTDPPMGGKDVLLLQERLLALGYNDVGTADGTFDSQTESAIRLFQKTNGLAADGYVGLLNWERLFSQDAIHK